MALSALNFDLYTLIPHQHHPQQPSMVGVVQERVQGREGPLGAFRSFAEAIQHPDP
jgi:hypothetical protein